MRGHGKTVFHGLSLDFDVEVIAVLDGAGKLSDLILYACQARLRMQADSRGDERQPV